MLTILSDWVAEVSQATNGGAVTLRPSLTLGLVISVTWKEGDVRKRVGRAFTLADLNSLTEAGWRHELDQISRDVRRT